MNSLASPTVIASLVTRNLAPAIGVLVLGWSAANLLVLYYIDTVLAFAGLVVLIARHVTGMGKAGARGRPMHGPSDWLRVSVGAMLGAVLVCLPLGVPLFMVLAQFDWSPAVAFGDRSFLVGLTVQVAGSVSGCVQAHRDLLARDDDERVLKHRAAFIVARWMVVVMAVVIGPFALLGPWIGGALIVLAYAGATIYFELFPGRALAWLNPREARADAGRVARPGKKRGR